MNAVKKVVHILCVCQCNSEVREEQWEKVEECSPGEMVINMNSMSVEDSATEMFNTFV